MWDHLDGQAIFTHIVDHDLGFPFGAEAGFIIGRDPDTVRAPDFAFVRKDRVPGGRLPKGFFPGAPDLAVEVLSPSDRVVEVEDGVRSGSSTARNKFGWSTCIGGP